MGTQMIETSFQISIIDTELQQKIKKGLEKDQITQQVIKGLTEKELTPLK